MEFRDAKGARLVEVGQAMLFSHREPTIYCYPEGETRPYENLYLALSPSEGIKPLYEAVRADFGSVVVMRESGDAACLLSEVFRLHKRGGFQDRFEESEMLYRLLLAIYREQVHGTRERDPIEFGYHLMRDRFRSRIHLEEVAEECGVTREHFTREYRRRFGESPGDQLRRWRLGRAFEMLKVTRTPIEDIALLCGFGSSNTFGRAFRRHYGCSPSSIRKEAQLASVS